VNPLLDLVSQPFRWLLNGMGGSVRYVYGTGIRVMRLTKRRPYAYREYLHGPDVQDDPLFDRDAHRFNNMAVGIGTLFFSVVLAQGC